MGNDMMEAYLYEMNTLLEQVDEIVLSAEKNRSFSEDEVNELFRIMHTFKGSSAMMEFNSLMTVAHRVEDLFFIIREKGMAVIPEGLRPELFDLIFQAVDFIRGEVEKIENGQPLTNDIDDIVKKISSFQQKIQNKEEGAAEEPAAEEPKANAGASFACREFPYTLQVFFDEGCGMENLRAYMLVNSIRQGGATGFDYIPEDVDTNAESAAFIIENGFILRFESVEEREAAMPIVNGTSTVSICQAIDFVAPAAEPKPEPEARAEEPAAPAAEVQQPEPAQTPAQTAAASASGKQQQAQHAKESLISVNLGKLDMLMAVVGEIVITESMVTASPDLRGLKLDNFTQASRQLRSLTDDLQDISMSLRMVPVSATFQKMKRIVRDMSKKLGRETVLELVGEDTEVDKTIVDSISDPIMHIVRNSMDHGIEEHAEERIAAGKSPVGKIILSARHTGGEVIIEVIDDGRGADDDAILNKALRQGVAQPGVEYSHKDILNFLLMPGFSTNTEVTEYSGRGVGMDVVKSNVESVGGTVSITSEKGQGMTTTLKIPLTMAILDGMEVAVGDSVFTVPINYIRQIFKLSEADIVHDAVHGEMLRLSDNYYPVVRAKNFYNLEQGADSLEDGIVLWVESGENSYCLFVDELIGQQQVVVKPLPAYINDYGIKSYGIGGCTILGDGTISIILDVASIYNVAQNN